MKKRSAIATSACAIAATLWLAPTSAAPAASERIVSISVCTDEYVFRLVPRGRIAALSFLAGDRHPVVSTIADRVKGIRLIRQTAEEVLAARPDVVVMDEGAQARVRAILNDARIRIVDVPWVSDFAGVRKTTRDLARALGAVDAGERLLAEMDSRLATARANAPKPAVRALIYEPNGYTVAGGITDAVMGESGLVNAAYGMRLTRQGTIPVEAVIASAPELLILGAQAGQSDSRARQVQLHPAFAALEGRTHRTWLSTTPLLCPGPWSAAAAADFVRAARAARSATSRSSPTDRSPPGSRRGR
jgi:iron complex transport system substrate-binding protein